MDDIINKNLYKTDIAIVGAGASGMMAALSATNYDVNITLIEHNDRVGKKILSTGNGKCNLSHTKIESTCYNGSFLSDLESFFSRFSVSDTLSFFSEIGILTKEKNGCIYPYSETASSVLDALRFECKVRGINTITNFETKTIQLINNEYLITSLDKKTIIAKKLIISTGGLAAPKSGSDGCIFDALKELGIKRPEYVPALVKLKASDNYCKALDGVRAKGNISLIIDDKTFKDASLGEIQFTKDGISGIPVFDISGRVVFALKQKSHVTISIDLIPEYSTDELSELILGRASKFGDLTSEELLSAYLNKKIIMVAMKLANIKSDYGAKLLRKKQIYSFVNILKNFTFNIIDSYGFEQAQVSAGGIKRNEVNDNLESIIKPGMYFAGEILDVDGKCGGYNLQWAWTSGYIAGVSAARSINNETFNY